MKDLIISLSNKNRKTIIPTVTSRLYFLRKFAIINLMIFIYYVKINKNEISLMKKGGFPYKQKSPTFLLDFCSPYWRKLQF
jgi:hypothetical protein